MWDELNSTFDSHPKMIINYNYSYNMLNYLEMAYESDEDNVLLMTEEVLEQSPEPIVVEDEPPARATKRRRTLKRKMDEMDGTQIAPSSDTGTGTASFNVASSTNQQLYRVDIRFDNGFNFACTCGDQFGVPTRDHCKHIGNVITNMMKTYVTLYTTKGKSKLKNGGIIHDMAIDDITDIFSKMLQISTGK